MEPVHRVNLCLYRGATQDSPELCSCLESIQASGCHELDCTGRCVGTRSSINGTISSCGSSLQVISIESPLLFAPSAVSFTMTALHNAPLQQLTLVNTALSPDMWKNLLESLELPRLSALAVDVKCPIPTLVDFLLKHQVQDLRVHSDDKHRITNGIKLHSRPRSFLSSLAMLDAPADVINGLLCYAQ